MNSFDSKYITSFIEALKLIKKNEKLGERIFVRFLFFFIPLCSSIHLIIFYNFLRFVTEFL